jgi:hypothetical protein
MFIFINCITELFNSILLLFGIWGVFHTVGEMGIAKLIISDYYSIMLSVGIDEDICELHFRDLNRILGAKW